MIANQRGNLPKQDAAKAAVSSSREERRPILDGFQPIYKRRSANIDRFFILPSRGGVLAAEDG
jgi:hypothetical protein